LHGLCIPYSDVILLCFSVVNPQSFQNAITYWLSRARRSNAKIPIILVGTQMDLRSDLQTLLTLDQQKLKPVTEKEARTRAQQMHACTYIECSALTEKNIKTVFDTAVLSAIEFRDTNTAMPMPSTSVLPLIEQQKNQQATKTMTTTTTSKQPTRHHQSHSHSHSTKTWRKLVSGCIGV
jgi:Ras homolog gene family, member U